MLWPEKQLHRRKLIWDIAVLVALCSLPLAGLAYYFLSTGLRRETAVADAEHQALPHMGRAVSVLDQAVELSWSNSGDDEALMEKLGNEITRLEQQQAIYGSVPKLTPVVLPPNSTATEQKPAIQKLWTDVRSSSAGTTDRTKALRRFVSRLHENIFLAGDATGLGNGPESEIGFLADIVTVGLPLHVERLMQMHERMGPPLRDKDWDDKTVASAAIFSRQLDDEDAKRFVHNSTAALNHDKNSAHVLRASKTIIPRSPNRF